ncbi:MAG: glycoside hydrolase family 97 catalytic domain-containing protein, partial [Bacteroidota bacterium]|nr:glycoside hydrolase family 97 catalytic domain-containing protein [Bacteroidota bacterium]
VACQHGKKLTILESDLESYPGMFVQAQPGKPALKGVFAQLPSKTDYYPWRRQLYITERGSNIAQTNGNRSYPWRVLAISQKDIDMPVNNLVYALASSNRIGDVSWIKTGKVAWDWWNDWGLSGVNFKAGINMDTYKYYIDFASAHGIEFIVLDEGWYKPSGGDMLTTIPEINLPELIAYGKKKHVDIVLWTVFNVLDDQLEAACKKYSEMGVKGFKVDFLDRDDQTAVDMVYRIAACAAKYHLTLDFHGIYKPTGLNRTYPNVINFESVFGMEEAKWSTKEKDMPLYDVTFPYIRMMAGYVDFTPGAMRNATKNDFQPIYYNPMSMGTRCHQLGTYIVYDSPFTMLCDAPTNYEKEPAFTDFITSLPVEVDETKILDGELGQYIVSARKKSLQWYIGGLTNWDSRDVTIDFSFLGADEEYMATLYKDGVNADKQAEDYAVETFPVNKETKRTIHLASGGGFAMKLIRTFNQTDTHPEPVPANAEFPSFYKKCLYADGIPVLSSANVSDEALLQAKQIIQYMLAKRRDIKDELVTKGCRVMIVGAKEAVCDLPEYAKICNTPENIAYWNRRARGFGGAPEDALSASCGEENLICLPEDRYTGENILVHEFAHLFHTIGIVGLDPSFDKRLVQVMEHAKANGLWAKTYALTDKFEYFAEATQSFFSCNRYSDTPNGVHNGINRRSKLRDYDSEMYQLLSDYFEETDIPLCNVIHQ